ncbi:MAG: P-loop NTPase [Deltaproteobacteria bacterium]|nr:P-loop NTPase [Deltaproteobacteria bacterium]
MTTKNRKVEFHLQQKQAQDAAAKVAHTILVMSGKGGVGKTTVAVNLAFGLAAEGYHIGILDADLHGPNAALMAGVEGTPAGAENGRILPVYANPKVQVLSISAFLPDKDTPVIWRGPRKAGAIQQFLAEGDWSHADVLVVDCPPGTGDEPLSVAQLMPNTDGVVVVTTPQDVALLDSRKSINFVRELKLECLGVVENMSGFICPHCGEHVDLFKKGGGEAAASQMGVPFLGRVPLTVDVVLSGDSGKPIVESKPDDPAAIALMDIVRKLARRFADQDKAKGAKTSHTEAKPTAQAVTETAKVPEQTADASVATSDAAPGNGHRILAVATNGDQGLDAPVSGHFGRCTHYTVVTMKGEEVDGARSVENPFASSHDPGDLPGFVKELGAHAILAGGMGPKAVDLFRQFDIDVGVGANGTVREAVVAYMARQLSSDADCGDEPHVHHHHH